jgi:hypothetical protein
MDVLPSAADPGNGWPVRGRRAQRPPLQADCTGTAGHPKLRTTAMLFKTQHSRHVGLLTALDISSGPRRVRFPSDRFSTSASQRIDAGCQDPTY